ncbi:glycoside hydrolase superfamily [Pilobolus umbonatus]|nr:glycoside hydrolase superfamily [Pilobolus umbonatus]
MKKKGVSSIRTYSQECDQLPHILTGIEQCGGGMTVLASVWIDGSDRDNQEISTLKNFLSSSSHQSAISGIIVGNEVLFNGRMSASSLAQKIKSVKSFAKGYKVTTSEIDTTYADEVMDVVDFASVNLHPYFSSNDISMAMDTLKSQFNNFKKKAHGKEVLITETGWPSAGASLGNAVASVENAQAYFVSLGQSGLPYYYFEWQDSNWKSPGQYAVENHFGFLNSKGAMKFAV